MEVPTEMRALVFKEKGKIEVVKKPVPVPKDGEVLLKITCTTICGTDIHIWKGEYPVKPGLTLGHEPIGVIAKVGPGVKSVKVGDRVCVGAITPCGVCNNCQLGCTSQCGGLGNGWMFGNVIDGCQADYVLVPNADYNCALIPDELTDEQVVMCCDIMSTGFSAVEKANVRIGDSVVITAQGPIGLCSTAAAKLSGATRIYAVETNPKRREIAKMYGADATIDFKTTDVVAEVKKLTDNRGVDVAVEALGIQSTFETCTRCVRPGGAVSSLGVYSNDIVLPLSAIGAGLGDHRFHFTLCPGGKERMRRLMDVIRSGRMDTKVLATHRFKLDQIVEAYAHFAEQRDGVLKVIITP